MFIDASTGSASTLSKVEWVDTHSHLNFPVFDVDREEVIKRCLENNIWLINIGTNYETSKKAVEIAEKYEKGVYAAIGLHPMNLDTGLIKMKVDEKEDAHFEKDFDYEKYKNLAQSKKVVAIGEIGLDYYWKPKTTKKKELFKEKQKDLFLKELKLAEELNLPVIFHCRMAHQDLVEVLKFEIRNPKSETNSKSQILNSKIRGVMHGFVGTIDQLKEYLRMGFHIGFNGIIFKKIEGIKVTETSSHLPPRATSSHSVFEENIKNTPLDRILIETDCPYLTPLPAEALAKAGPLPIRNEPLYVKYIAEKIAEIKKLTFDKIAEITTENAKRLFKLG